MNDLWTALFRCIRGLSFRACRFVNTWHDYGMHHCRLSDFDFVMNDDLKTYSDVTPHLDVTVVVFNAS